MSFRSASFLHRLFRYRSTRITSEGLQFLIFTLAIGIAAINTGNNLFYLLLAMMLSLILVSGMIAEYCLRRLELHRHLPDLLFVNMPITVALVVKNRKAKFASFSLAICDVINGRDFSPCMEVRYLPSHASQLLSYPLTPTRRGRLQLEGARISTEFPFGLFTKRTFYPLEETVVVCPEIQPLDERLLRGLFAAGHEQTVHRRGHGNDLYNLRLYHAGDDSRSIHWPTTARTSQLTIRETEAEEQRRAIIHVPTTAPVSHDAVFERAVSLAASLIQRLAHDGYCLQLLVGSDRSSFGQGEVHSLELLRMLAFCERNPPTNEFTVSEEPPSQPFEVGEGGTLILVQSWRGPGDIETEHPLVLVDGEVVFGGTRAF
jgi:uncharacterized protein (DUF58 family)